MRVVLLKHNGILSIRYLSLLALLISGPLCSKAALLVRYDFNAAAFPTITAPNVLGSAATWSFTSGDFGFDTSLESAFVRTDATSSSFDENDYLTFTIFAGTGFVFNLTSFNFGMGGNSSPGTGNYVASSQIRTDAEASPFSTSLVLTPGDVTEINSSIFNGTTAIFPYSADLSAASFQGVNSITFRAYIYDNIDATTAFDRFYDFEINGEVVAIPEPTTAVMLAFGLLGVATRRVSRK